MGRVRVIVVPIPFLERISIWACFSSKNVLQNNSSSIGISPVPPPEARSTRPGSIPATESETETTTWYDNLQASKLTLPPSIEYLMLLNMAF